MVAAWLGKPENQKKISSWVLSRVPFWLSKYGQLSGGAISRTSVMELKAESFRPMADYAVRSFYNFAEQPEFKQRIREILEKYMDSQLQGPMAMMMAGFAQSVNIINVDEASQLVQKKLLCLLEKAQQENTAEYEQVQESLRTFFSYYEKNLAAKQELNAVLLNKDKLDIAGYLLCQNGQLSGQVREQLLQLLDNLWLQVEKILATNNILQNELNALIYQMAARGALQAQELLGKITNDVLGTMTDEQINRLVYDKAEPDLLWIRMNGSIVGASIGLVVFAIMQFM